MVIFNFKFIEKKGATTYNNNNNNNNILTYLCFSMGPCKLKQKYKKIQKNKSYPLNEE